MTDSALARDEAWRAPPESLEALLANATRYGRPSLRQIDNGAWHASIEFNSIPGCHLTASSEFDHARPYDALRLAVDRVEQIRRFFA